MSPKTSGDASGDASDVTLFIMFLYGHIKTSNVFMEGHPILVF